MNEEKYNYASHPLKDHITKDLKCKLYEHIINNKLNLANALVVNKKLLIQYEIIEYLQLLRELFGSMFAISMNYRKSRVVKQFHSRPNTTLNHIQRTLNINQTFRIREINCRIDFACNFNAN